jgi:energy-converting hydrogenase Eha subunit A
VTYRRPDGLLERWESRAHRKHHNRLDTGRGSTWWAPGAVAWWIGVLFMIGSACFAVGAVPGYVSWVGVSSDNVTFFVGSIFFTSAGALQYLEVVNADPVEGAPSARRAVRLVTWEPHRVDWWATAVQLLGTVFFNISTLAALLGSLGADRANQFVWRPDMYGSVCFLVASELAFAEIGGRLISWRPRVRSWWIAVLNLGGSVAFGVSAVAAKVVSGSGEPRNIELVNLGTFVGALGFLVGAFLLLPERTESPVPKLVAVH